MLKRKGFKVFICLILTIVIFAVLSVIVNADINDVFTDVPNNSWYSSYVEYVYNNNLMNGITTSEFEPKSNMNRAMIVTVLWRLDDCPIVNIDCPFEDVTNQWFKDAVLWAYDTKIVNGTDSTHFSPYADVTRQQLAAIMYRYAQYKNADTSKRGNISDFSDSASVQVYATEAFSWAVGEELINGVAADGVALLDPRGNAQRCQVAAILMRFRENIHAPYIETPAKDSTCVEIGHTVHIKCSICNITLESSVEIGLADHSTVIDEGVDATCTSTGLTEGSHCSVCNEVFIPQEVIPLADHSTVIDEGVDATCTSTGLTEGSHCSVCHLVLIEQNEIPVLGHSYDFSSIPIKCIRCGSGYQDMEILSGNSTYGYNYLINEENGDNMQKLYRELFKFAEEFRKGERQIYKKTYNSISYNVLAEIRTTGYPLNKVEINTTWAVFCEDNPRYYWISNFVLSGDGILVFCVDDNYTDPQFIAECEAQVESMLKEFNLLIGKNDTALSVAVKAHNFIIDRIDYSYEADGVTPQDDKWAHNIMGVVTKKGGVCESYAKTYSLLCTANGVDCLYVKGDVIPDGKHAWNLIKINSKWYGVDVTWDDAMPEVYKYKYFGMSANDINSNRVADTPEMKGINYLYGLPTVSSTPLNPFDFGLNAA